MATKKELPTSVSVTFENELKPRLDSIGSHAERLGVKLDGDTSRLEQCLRLVASSGMGDRYSEQVYLKIDDFYEWACDVSITLSLHQSDSKFGVHCEAQLGWSASNRTVAHAVSALEVYQRAVSFAAHAEGIINR